MTAGAGSVSPSAKAPAPDAASQLGDAQLAGQRIVTGFSGETPPAALEQRIRDGEIAGVILFSENFDNRGEARELIRRLQGIPRPNEVSDPLLVMIDQEGGQVKRLPGPPSMSAERMGQMGPGVARRQGRATGRMLARTGVNVDLAPVLDIGRGGGAIAMEDRAFASSVRGVTSSANAFAQGLRSAGVAAAAKHFPGLGSARVNTDDAVQRIRISKTRLRRADEKPYERFVKRGGELVMLGMAVYPAFSDRPAALAREIATGELRERLGFDGVSITDALGTASGSAFGSPGELARQGAAAGTDLLLFERFDDAEQAAGTLRDALASGQLDRDAFLASVQRVLDLRERLGR